jgi:hypothetical protein
LRTHSTLSASLEKCKLAYDQSARFDTASALGFVYLAIGDRANAQRYLGEAARRMPDTTHAEVRSQFNERLRQLAVSVDSTSDDPEITAGPEGAGPQERWVYPGSITALFGIAFGAGLMTSATARRSNGTHRLEVVAAAGETCDSPSSVYLSVCEEASRNNNAARALTIGGGVSFGVAGAAAVATIIYAVSATGSDDDAMARLPRPTPIFIAGRPAGLGLELRF